MDEEEENEILDCPCCGRTYIDADADFLICHHCGYDAVRKIRLEGNRRRDISRYGIDPDVQLDDWG